jgi:hypothetical protein
MMQVPAAIGSLCESQKLPMKTSMIIPFWEPPVSPRRNEIAAIPFGSATPMGRRRARVRADAVPGGVSANDPDPLAGS